MKRFIATGAALALLSVPSVAQPRPDPWAGNPNAGWFSRQHNTDGGYCCDGYDAHLYYGSYTLNSDGSVSLPLADGNTLSIPSGHVLPFNPIDPNPMGTAVLWYNGSLQSEFTISVYCMALGPLT